MSKLGRCYDKPKISEFSVSFSTLQVNPLNIIPPKAFISILICITRIVFSCHSTIAIALLLRLSLYSCLNRSIATLVHKEPSLILQEDLLGSGKTLYTEII